MNDFGRHGLISSDAEKYSSRNEVDQHELQRVIVDTYETAAREAGLDRSGWMVQPSGDGELAVLPRNQLMTQVIDKLPQAMCAALDAHNRAARTELRLRMRMALHEGLVQRSAGGYAGTGVITVSRIVDSPVARQALTACQDTDLVVLLSPILYNEYVRQGHTVLAPEEFREVTVSVKTFRDTAWLHVPGHDVHSLKLDEPAATPQRAAREPAPAAPAQERATVSITHHGDITGDENVFGISYRSNG